MNDWKLNAGVQYLNGKLHGYAVEANGIQDDGETLNRNYNYRELKWQDTDAQIQPYRQFPAFRVQLIL